MWEAFGDEFAWVVGVAGNHDTFLSGCQTLVCENNYRDADADLARKNYHMTSSVVARLASRVGPDKVVLFHVSDRYDVQAWREQLAEVRGRFDRAVFPQEWGIE